MFDQHAIGFTPFNASPVVADEFTEKEWRETMYVFQRRGVLARQVLRLGRVLVERARSAGLRWLRMALVATAPSNLLWVHGRDKALPALPGELPNDHRGRLLDAPTWHSYRGWHHGIYHAYRYLGLIPGGVYRFRVARPLWGAASIGVLDIWEGSAIGLRWLVQTEDKDGVTAWYYWTGAAWAETDLEDLDDDGNTAEELLALSDEQLSELLPCGTVIFATSLTGDNWFVSQSLRVSLEAEFYV